MTVNLESTLGVDASPLRADRRHAGARQDRWMLEFEKAFTTSGDARDDGGEKGAPVAAAGPASARMPPSSPAHAAAAPALRAAPSHSAARTMPPHAALHTARADARDAAAPASAGSHGKADGSVAESGTQDMAPAVAAGAATAARVSPAGSAVLESAGVDALRGAARIAPSLFLSAISGAGLAAQQAAAYGAPAFQEASAGAAKRSPAGTPFDARAMHLFVDSQGVHAFIRDTALQANELRTVAQGLAAEMAATGQQLASLTVNGKNVAARTPHAEAEEDDAVFQQNPDGGAESSLRYPSQPVSEGNP